jgi:hypothetical protein
MRVATLFNGRMRPAISQRQAGPFGFGRAQGARGQSTAGNRGCPWRRNGHSVGCPAPTIAY